MFLLLAFVGIVHADPTQTYLREGEPAPFSGTLFNDEASAELEVTLRSAETRCQLRIDEAVEKKEAEKDLEVAKAVIGLQACEERQAIIESYTNKQLADQQVLLTKTVAPKFRVAPFVSGVGLGIGTSLLVAYGYSQIEEHSR